VKNDALTVGDRLLAGYYQSTNRPQDDAEMLADWNETAFVEGIRQFDTADELRAYALDVIARLRQEENHDHN
jgi:hypothetical protein